MPVYDLPNELLPFNTPVGISRVLSFRPVLRGFWDGFVLFSPLSPCFIGPNRLIPPCIAPGFDENVRNEQKRRFYTFDQRIRALAIPNILVQLRYTPLLYHMEGYPEVYTPLLYTWEATLRGIYTPVTHPGRLP